MSARVRMVIVTVLVVLLSGVSVSAEGLTVADLEGEGMNLSPRTYVRSFGMLVFQLSDAAGQPKGYEIALYWEHADGSLSEVWSSLSPTSGEEITTPNQGWYRLGVVTKEFVEWNIFQEEEYKTTINATVAPFRLSVEPDRISVEEFTEILVKWAPSGRAVRAHWELYVMSENWMRRVDWTLEYGRQDLNVVAFSTPRSGLVRVQWIEYGAEGEVITFGEISKMLEVISPTPTAMPTNTPTQTVTPTNTPRPTATSTPAPRVEIVTPMGGQVFQVGQTVTLGVRVSARVWKVALIAMFDEHHTAGVWQEYLTNGQENFVIAHTFENPGRQRLWMLGYSPQGQCYYWSEEFEVWPTPQPRPTETATPTRTPEPPNRRVPPVYLPFVGR